MRFAIVTGWTLCITGCLALYVYALARAGVLRFQPADLCDGLAVAAGFACIALIVGLEVALPPRRRR